MNASILWRNTIVSRKCGSVLMTEHRKISFLSIIMARNLEESLTSSSMKHYRMESANFTLKVSIGTYTPVVICAAYVFRVAGNCLRCRSHFKHAVMAKGKGESAYSINLCETCTMLTSHLTRLRGNGDAIWNTNKDCPKTFFKDLKASMLDPDRNESIKIRAEEAWLHVLTAAKERRDAVRSQLCKAKAEAEYGIKSGHYVSWGFGDNFDEYFGSVDDSGKPYEYGVRFYSDGSVYVGPWHSGVMRTSAQYPKGTMSRPDGALYEGQWLSGRKQGDPCVIVYGFDSYIYSIFIYHYNRLVCIFIFFN